MKKFFILFLPFLHSFLYGESLQKAAGLGPLKFEDPRTLYCYGLAHFCKIEDNHVFCFGDNRFQQSNPSSRSKYVKEYVSLANTDAAKRISCGDVFTVLLNQAKLLSVWGRVMSSDYSLSLQSSDIVNGLQGTVLDVVSGDNFICTLRENSFVSCSHNLKLSEYAKVGSLSARGRNFCFEGKSHVKCIRDNEKIEIPLSEHLETFQAFDEGVCYLKREKKTLQFYCQRFSSENVVIEVDRNLIEESAKAYFDCGRKHCCFKNHHNLTCLGDDTYKQLFTDYLSKISKLDMSKAPLTMTPYGTCLNVGERRLCSGKQ